MRRKARRIGRSKWKTPKGKHISAKNLYSIYSSNDKNQTFINYARNTKGILKLNDSEVDSLIKNSKYLVAIKSFFQPEMPMKSAFLPCEKSSCKG